MRIACIYLPNLVYQTECLRSPEIEGLPIIIRGVREKRNCVADCSPEAAAQGVLRGMTLQKAYRRCPDALLLPHSNSCEPVWEKVVLALDAFSLEIDQENREFVFLDVTREAEIYDDERHLSRAVIQTVWESSCLKARVGVGNSRFIAKQAALCASDSLIIEPGSEKDFFPFIPVGALPIADETKKRLRLLGLTTLLKVALLPRPALVSRFGPVGVTLFEIANGLDGRTPILPCLNGCSREGESRSHIPSSMPTTIKARIAELPERRFEFASS
jgi:DNA polymerase IV